MGTSLLHVSRLTEQVHFRSYRINWEVGECMACCSGKSKPWRNYRKVGLCPWHNPLSSVCDLPRPTPTCVVLCGTPIGLASSLLTKFTSSLKLNNFSRYPIVLLAREDVDLRDQFTTRFLSIVLFVSSSRGICILKELPLNGMIPFTGLFRTNLKRN